MESISVFDILKIGVGPSSSHTLGPWLASAQFITQLRNEGILESIRGITVLLYGSLALTGKGHATDMAIVLGLSGQAPETIGTDEIQSIPQHVRENHELHLDEKNRISFNPEEDIHFLTRERLPYHANGMKFMALGADGSVCCTSIYYSVGGGFILHESEIDSTNAGEQKPVTFPCTNAAELLEHCADQSISDMVFQNELAWRTESQIDERLHSLWNVMKASVFKGCHHYGKLPGGLDVSRRAAKISHRLLDSDESEDVDVWIENIKNQYFDFSDIIKWIGCFSMAVNEVNASFGRIVTAPTNGSAGVIPAVLLYFKCFAKKDVSEEEIQRFLLTAGQIGILFKIGSTLSAAMGGCQAEIGVSSAMAAGALTEGLGGTPQQALMAAEIAMEHHLGLTCDPIGGLVQIPCIERNSMGAIKAVTAATIALASDPNDAKVSLDGVIKSMWETAKDMNSNYKETSLGGLAVNVSVKVSEC
jgi:L-serine dehydratase